MQTIEETLFANSETKEKNARSNKPRTFCDPTRNRDSALTLEVHVFT
jgi:hypothetical protein